MELRRAHHAEAAVVERDEGEVGAGHHRRACRPWARSRAARRWSAHRRPTSRSRSAHRAPPPTKRKSASSREPGGGVEHGAEAMADPGVAEVQDDRAAVDAQRVVARPTARPAASGNCSSRSQLGITSKRGRSSDAAYCVRRSSTMAPSSPTTTSTRRNSHRLRRRRHRARAPPGGELAEALGRVRVAVHAPQHDPRAAVDELVEHGGEHHERRRRHRDDHVLAREQRAAAGPPRRRR